MKQYYVYILANKKNGIFYTGVNSDLMKRMHQHKNNIFEGFTSKYKVYKLVYYKETNDINSAIAEEKRINGLSRVKKIAIIENNNTEWMDLSLGWFD
jgi:putative endonuclease